jgi:hypothetical protein
VALVGREDSNDWNAALCFGGAAVGLAAYIYKRRGLLPLDLAYEGLVRPLKGPHPALRTEIVSRALAVAVLELEERGFVTLDVSTGEPWLRPRLEASGRSISRDTPEAGLLRGRDMRLADAVHDFLASGSEDPWDRAVRLLDHLLAKRGVAPAAVVLRDDASVRVRNLLAAETQRPELWAALRTSIWRGIESRRVAPRTSSEGGSSPIAFNETPIETLSAGVVEEDPLKDAAAKIVRQRFSYLLVTGVSAGATFACSSISWAWDGGYMVGVIFAVLVAGVSLILHGVRRYWQLRGINIMEGREHLDVSLWDAFLGSALAGAVIALFATLVGPVIGIGGFALLLVASLIKVREYILPTRQQLGGAVTRRMRELKKSLPTAASNPVEIGGPVMAATETRAIQLNIRGAHALPSGQATPRACFERWIETSRAMLRVDFWSFGSATVLTVGYWALQAIFHHDVAMIIAAPFLMAALWVVSNRWNSRTEPEEPDPQTEIPTNLSTRLHHRIWWGAALVAAAGFAAADSDYSPGPVDLGWFAGFTVMFGLHAGATWLARRRVLQRYPLPAPRRLVMLRVFGSPSFDDLTALIRPWGRVGTIEHLEGADSVGTRGDVIAAAAGGRIDDVLVKSDEELMRKLVEFSLIPDANLRFKRHAFQCTGTTWKRAILTMLDRADAVVMDLSSLSPANQGCAWELEQLMQRVPLQRVVLLVNDSTNLDTLRTILEAGAARLTSDSPNAGRATLEWNVIRIGGLSARLETESYHEWLRRSDLRLEAMPLCEHLLETAGLPQPSPASTGGSAWLATHLRPSVRRWLVLFGIAWAWLAWLAL